MGTGVSTKRGRDMVVVPDSGKCRHCRDVGRKTQQEEEINNEEPEFVNTTKRMSMYPQRITDKQETVLVSNSEFPYFKPKAVTVRQKPVERVIPHHINNVRNDDINDVHSTQFLLYNERHPLFDPDQANYYASRSHARPYHYVNERRWSVPNVMPANNFQPDNLRRAVGSSQDSSHQNGLTKSMQPGNILVHKTVAQLRASNQIQPYGRHYSYVCDLEPASVSVAISGAARPPTPTPNTWYPAHRTSDYLVASSLLAREQQIDRRNNHR